ncbi:MAG TPA: bi-domain-containing oxidoreductase [Candidatus Babeliales bacterium]|nr:bi-domain-containing oxidoreductase [Candidatus Babeliales bacterium]
MRQVFLQKGSVVLQQVSRPALDDYSVLVAVHYSFISTDAELAAIVNSAQRLSVTNVPQKIKKLLESLVIKNIEEPKLNIGDFQSLGYSCSGEVIAVGKKVTRIRAGDLVACAGVDYAYHADVVCVPENLVVRVRGKQHLISASVTAIGSIALQGIRRAQLQLGEYVCVAGLGLLGQITVQLAKQSGCIVIGVDHSDERLALAQKLGADVVLHAGRDDVQKEIAFYTNLQGVDVTMITAASHTDNTDSVMQQALTITRKKGRLVLVGDVRLTFERNLLCSKEIDFLVSHASGPGSSDPEYEQKGQDYPYSYVRWTENRNMQAFVDFIERKQVDVQSLINAQIGIEDAVQAYELLAKKECLGVVLCYGAEDGDKVKIQPAVRERVQQSPIRFVPAVQDTIRVGLVGASKLAQVRLMPIIAKIKRVSIDVVVDKNVAMSLYVAQKYGAAKTLVEDVHLFNDDLVDVVVIASSHKFHCDQALHALKNGKAVFLEKPMVTDFDQLDRFMAFIEKHPQIPFCVDYSRSFSPFIQKIKRTIQNRKTPLAIQYRMNVKERWAQTDLGAGRIIGEACHIFDLFYYLVGAKPVAISVEVLHAGNTSLFPTDNFSAQISFADGSICSLLYTVLGHKDLGKERMELFFDSKSIVMDDYDYLTGFGLPKSFDELLEEPDKGYATLLNQFFKQVKEEFFVPPISVDRLRTVAQITLIIDRLACEGGGTQAL